MRPNGPVFDASWRAACSLEPVGRKEVDWMIREHYLGKWPGVWKHRFVYFLHVTSDTANLRKIKKELDQDVAQSRLVQSNRHHGGAGL